mmetsp:Transcript_70408/g.195959  ORF Transcript_70408/g.195959 Transcript_70408/m.195959 type:complete len:142 (-) Transcript_70408:15-440(-)
MGHWAFLCPGFPQHWQTSECPNAFALRLPGGAAAFEFAGSARKKDCLQALLRCPVIPQRSHTLFLAGHSGLLWPGLPQQEQNPAADEALTILALGFRPNFELGLALGFGPPMLSSRRSTMLPAAQVGTPLQPAAGRFEPTA